ncbi:carbohydrate binding domain-containing protein [Thiohalobacter thiocyanaticus]|uniref:CBM-cenC domain-containing protein n=1 Tax=Thiohalobacter thiocyanaticus TaxID=585455 RepID=A0A426QIW8_9GAMM|nr:carbohydrate binding domain-containing protein [Thiohalobacter thiocyanaticus]RRQ21647.1 hypothetical protein D6C00_06590 [Thiohalobacter thiocyanaticus]
MFDMSRVKHNDHPQPERRGWPRWLMALAATLIVAVVNGAASSPVYADELLHNPGFEEPYRNGLSVGWRDNSGWADVDVEYSRDTDAVRGVSQHIISHRVSAGAVQFVQKKIPLEEGKSYLVSLWMKGDVEGPVEVMLRKHGKPYTTYARKALRVSNEWSLYEFQLNSAVDDPSALFMVRTAGRGQIWLDEASMKEASEALSAAPETGNLIANGSFEADMDRWAVQVRESGGYRHEMPVSFADVRPSIITGEVPHGLHAMRLDLPLHTRMRITTPSFPVSPGDVYTASLWVKSDRPRTLTISMKDMGLGAQKILSKRIKVSGNWERYYFTVEIPPASGRSQILMVESIGKGSIWIDGVQVELGEKRKFVPARPVEVGFRREGKPHLYHPDQPVVLELCLAAHEVIDEGYSLLVNSRDFHGMERELTSINVYRDSPGTQCYSINHPSDETGYFRILASVSRNGTVVDRATIAIGVVPERSGPPLSASPFGGHARFNPSSLIAMRKLGVSWLRMHPPLGTKWFVVEPEQGRFEFIDEPIQYAKDLGFYILGSLDATPRWSSSAPPAMQTESAHGYRAYPPRDISDWGNYVETIVDRYEGVIDHWEVWNEPDSGGFLKLPETSESPFEKSRKAQVYVELVKAAYNAAKSVNPGAVMVAGAGTNHPPVRWIEHIIDNGLAGYFDVLSFHYYTSGRPIDMHDVPARERVEEVRKVAENGNDKHRVRIWETESGFPLEVCSPIAYGSPGEYCASDNESVAFLLRNYLEWFSSGVERWFFYHMFFPDRTDRTRLAGFFEWDRSPTALAIAYAVMADILREMEFKEFRELNDGVAVMEFAGNEKTVTAYWLKNWDPDAKVDVIMSQNEGDDGASIIDAMGVERDKVMPGEAVRIKVGRVPVYKVVQHNGSDAVVN